MTSLLRLVPISLLLVSPLAVHAQKRAPERPPEPAVRVAEPQVRAEPVPREMLPPTGKCRIWMDGVSPSQQPAPTDCHTALRQRPTNGTVVFGPSAKEPPVRAFARPRAVRDTTSRETSPSRTARPSNTPSRTRNDTTSRRRRPEQPS